MARFRLSALLVAVLVFSIASSFCSAMKSGSRGKMSGSRGMMTPGKTKGKMPGGPRPPGPHDHKSCDQTVSELVREEGCPCQCVEVEEETTPKGRVVSSCPVCIEDCTADNDTANATACPDEDCEADEVLLSVGPNGIDTCVSRLQPEAPCDAKMGPGSRPRPVGTNDRVALAEIDQAETPCVEGYVCQRSGVGKMTCQPVGEMAPCTDANKTAGFKCEKDGTFEPLQCVHVERDRPGPGPGGRRRRSKEQECRCVDPSNGTTIAGTEVVVGMGAKKPDCEEEAFEHCRVPSLYSVRGPKRRKDRRVNHLEVYFDSENCRVCQCVDGDPTAFCDDPNTGNCSVLTAEPPMNCTLPTNSSEVLQHGETVTLGCDICGCKDGRVRCTHVRRCNRPDVEEPPNRCNDCRRKPRNGSVCGPDNQNYNSRCEAMHCAGFSSADIENGPCQDQDVCSRYPCDDDDECLRKGGVVCLGKRCEPDDVRICVDKDNLKCPIANSSNTESNIEEGEVEDIEVCGSDGQTYDSICDLLQRSLGVQIEHAGACEDPACQTGPICGADGVTYSNVCVLRSQSNTRVDYAAMCIAGSMSLEEVCGTVRERGLCLFNESNCRQLVQPRDGCCPICGGSVSFPIDRDALEEASYNNRRQLTLDGFVEKMSDAEPLKSAEDKCDLEASTTDTRDLQIVLSAKEERYAATCHNRVRELASFVNAADDSPQPLPRVMDFVFAAAVEPTVESTTDMTTGTDEPTDDGAVTPIISMVTLFIAAALAF